MKLAIAIIQDVARNFGPGCIAFSGGTDSRVLVDLAYRHAGVSLPILAGPYNLKPPETRAYNQAVAAQYKAVIHHAPEAPVAPETQWRLFGWPMLGKMNARVWNKRNRHAGFKCDCSSCCKRLTIDPVRTAAKALGFRTILTGMRVSEALIREKKERQHPPIYWIKASRVYQANPIAHWTDTMVHRYVATHNLRLHPAKARGAKTIGCVICGGGAQFDESTWPICRRLWPRLWHQFIVEEKAGLVILAIKYNTSLSCVRQAVDSMGGLEHIAKTRPWVFDYLRNPPMTSYRK